jgi:large subunit ribosomal protein L4
VAHLKKFDMTGAEIGTIQIDDALLLARAHPQSIKDYIVALRYNARQWSANTKCRSEINRTGRKPHPQKGQGRSRQGDLAAPQYKGGGIVFGPKPKFDVNIRINKKERRAAIRTLIAEKIKANQVYILQKEEMERPQTKKMVAFFDKMQGTKRRALVLGESKGATGQMGNPHENLVKSLRNIPKKQYSLIPQINGYELALCQDIVVLESALSEFLSILGAS